MNSGHGKKWIVYAMAAKNGETTFFKVGLTSNFSKRLSAVQVGCPIRIAEAWTLNCLSNSHAQKMEAEAHRMLRSYRSCGEWFAFDVKDPDHKRDFNAMMAGLQTMASGQSGPKWKHVNVDLMKAVLREVAAEADSKGAAKIMHLQKMVRQARRGMSSQTI